MARSPGVGKNGGVEVGDEAWRTAVARTIIANECKEAVTERVKAQRKKIEGDFEIPLADVDYVVKNRNIDVEALVGEIKRRLGGLVATFMPGIKTQVDLFQGAPPPAERQAAYRMQGMMSGMNGAACKAPENLQSIEQQQWTEGWHDGAKARTEALKDVHTQALLKATTVVRAKPTEEKPATEAGKAAPPAKPPGNVKVLSDEKRARALAAAGGAPSADVATVQAEKELREENRPHRVEEPKSFTDPADGMKPLPTDAAAVAAQARADFEKDNPGQQSGDFTPATPEELAKQAGRPGGATDAKDPPKPQSQIAAEARDAAAAIGGKSKLN